jgi:hypothetical protein
MSINRSVVRLGSDLNLWCGSEGRGMEGEDQTVNANCQTQLESISGEKPRYTMIRFPNSNRTIISSPIRGSGKSGNESLIAISRTLVL